MMKRDKQTQTVEEALTAVWKILCHINMNMSDQIVLFYKITPYVKGTNGYISWFLSSKYSARNQTIGIPNIRTCWCGNPPDEHFIEQFRNSVVDLRRRMTNAIHEKTEYDYYYDLEGYRATDEVNQLDAIFFTPTVVDG